MDQRHFSEISSPSNQELKDLNGDAEGVTSDEDSFPKETLVVVIKEENIKIENKGSLSVQEEATSSNKHREEETVSEESNEEDSDEVSDKDTHGNLKEPKHKVYKYYRSVKQLCDDCGCFYNPKKAHTCEYKIKPYSCNMCGKRCCTKKSLKSHSHIHDNSKIHNCKYCYAPFGSKQDKMSHEETHKDDRSPFKCHSCPATFTHFLHRKKHLGTHPRTRQHKCEKCGSTFLKKHILDRHMMIHTGEKAYKCPVCNRCFNQLGNMKSHMRLHTGEKPYKCQFCDKGFTHNVSLKSHMQRYHCNNRLPNTEDAGGGTDRVNVPDATHEGKEVQVEVYKEGVTKKEKSSAKSKRKMNKSLQKRHKSGELSEEGSNSDWSSDINEEVEKRSQRE